MSASASADSDRTLLERLNASRDAAAIAEVVRRYAGLVYGTCLRRQAPNEAAVTCEAVFQAMIATPNLVTGRLPVWLHAAALARTGAGPGCVPPQAAEDWVALAPVIDDAIAALNPAERWQVLIAYGTLPPREHAVSHQREVEEALATDRAAALAALVHHLATAGVVIAPEPLAAALETNVMEMPPAVVTGRLARLALGALPSRPLEVENPALSRVRWYLGGAIAVLILVILIAIVIYVMSDKVVPGRSAPSAAPAGAMPASGS